MKMRASVLALTLFITLCACCLELPSLGKNQAAGGNSSSTSAFSSTSAASSTTSVPTTTEPPLPRNVTCEGKWGDVAKDRCFREWAIGTRNPRICEKIVYKSTRDNCFHSIALETGDVALCNRMLDDLNRKKCFDSIQSAEAS